MTLEMTPEQMERWDEQDCVSLTPKEEWSPRRLAILEELRAVQRKGLAERDRKALAEGG
ncbi:hypothetical protein [Acetobacter conturbans]|uniref:Uncharacterized protein n=1 Tax=Acetobacter conturbans TaxID=1737472 RepID=A0ABX0JY49_9PROT|nr:hypothetical protein [Acetobacter conturbans]NHN87930.1 hypothetical protein [Acetobacter conturbans]